MQELFAYARKQELDPEEFARRNRERQRQQDRDADQAEIATALHTPRRGRKHTVDQTWLTTEGALKARKGLRHIYHDAAPRPRRPRTT